MGDVIVNRNILAGSTRNTPIKRTKGARTRNGVSMNGPCPANKSMRSASIKPMLPTKQAYCNFLNMHYDISVFYGTRIRFSNGEKWNRTEVA